MRQSLKYVAQPRIGLLSVDLGGFDQAVDLRAGRGSLGRVTEQPGLAPDHKWLYGPLCQVVVDWQMARFDIPFQAVSVVCQVVRAGSRRKSGAHHRASGKRFECGVHGALTMD